MKRIYHVGLVAHGHTAVFQYREDVGCLSCEILDYLGRRETSKAHVKLALKNPSIKKDVLKLLQQQYPKCGFQNVRID